MDPPEFLCEVPDDLVCLVCMHAVGVGGPAAVTVGCGHLFCQGCLDTWLAGNATCPVDRQPLTKGDVRPDIRSQRRADALLVRCSGAVQSISNADDSMAREACLWQGAWSDLATHEKRCPAVAPKVYCTLRSLGCPATAFGTHSDVAGVATRMALHNSECADAHLRLLATAVVAERARSEELRGVVEGLVRELKELRQSAANAERRATAAEAAVDARFDAFAHGDLREVHDTLAVALRSAAGGSAGSPVATSCVAGAIARASAQPAAPTFAFTDAGQTQPQPQSPSAESVGRLGSGATTSLIEALTRKLFTQRPLENGDVFVHGTTPGWATVVGGPAGRIAADGSFAFAVALSDLRGVRDSADNGPLSGVMIGLTVNRGATLHHGRRGHLGYIPGSVGLQGSGFYWTGGASNTCLVDDSSSAQLTFDRGATVQVLLRASADNSRFVGVAFGVAGAWSRMQPCDALGAGPVYPAVTVISPEFGVRFVPPTTT
jgi:hypothetical protein